MRATFIARPRPASLARSKESARSIPVVTPADDQTKPSLDEDRIELDRHPGMALRQQRRVQPMRSRSPPVENASGGQKKAAKTYGAHSPTGVCLLSPTHRTRARSRVTSSTAKAPGTINVSIGSRPNDRTDSGYQLHAIGGFLGPPRIETTEHSYVTRLSPAPPKLDATWNASRGPAKSSKETPS